MTSQHHNRVTTFTHQEKHHMAVKTQPKNVAFSSAHVAYANVKGIDVTRAAKLNRSYIRSNFDTLVKVWPELAATQKRNRDANRYPTSIPSNVADAIVARNVKAPE
jgi:hypothetical protein